eukprot:TRINITY_DN758_c0_g2_i1.p1 TRINITY_DN758_c0_g2~~TRINITY_DN758_c0_g2_i1.p1  ORF type:complete len:243 (-),score=70.97 TRINITY_DN758_c0_g2_i1:925-1629(-)
MQHQHPHARTHEMVREMRTSVERFVSDGKENVSLARREHAEAQADFEKKLSTVKHQKKKLIATSDMSAREQDREQRQLKVLEKELQVLKKQQESLPKDLEKLKREAKNHERTLQKLRSLVSTKKTMSNIRTTELRKAIKMYEENLSLTIEEEEEKDEARFVFTMIDPKARGNEFYFVLRENLDADHQIRECEPMVAYQPLLEVFNQDKNYTKFMAGMRKLFQKSCQTSDIPFKL